jgi:hypothetical protein
MCSLFGILEHVNPAGLNNDAKGTVMPESTELSASRRLLGAGMATSAMAALAVLYAPMANAAPTGSTQTAAVQAASGQVSTQDCSNGQDCGGGGRGPIGGGHGGSGGE